MMRCWIGFLLQCKLTRVHPQLQGFTYASCSSSTRSYTPSNCLVSLFFLYTTWSKHHHPGSDRIHKQLLPLQPHEHCPVNSTDVSYSSHFPAAALLSRRSSAAANGSKNPKGLLSMSQQQRTPPSSLQEALSSCCMVVDDLSRARCSRASHSCSQAANRPRVVGAERVNCLHKGWREESERDLLEGHLFLPPWSPPAHTPLPPTPLVHTHSPPDPPLLHPPRSHPPLPRPPA